MVLSQYIKKTLRHRAVYEALMSGADRHVLQGQYGIKNTQELALSVMEALVSKGRLPQIGGKSYVRSLSAKEDVMAVKGKGAPVSMKIMAPAKRARVSGDAQEIFAAFKGGASLGELKEKYGITNRGSLAKVVLNALVAQGEVPNINPVKASMDFKGEATIDTRGFMVIPKAAVVQFGISPESTFTVKKRGPRIILTLVK